MPDQAVFDLARPDPVTRGLEQVIRSALIPEIAAVGQNSEVTGEPPVAAKLCLSGSGVVPVAKKQHGVGVSVLIVTVHSDFARLAGW